MLVFKTNIEPKSYLIIKSMHKENNLFAPQNSKPKVVVLTGAGISQESGIQTFRDAEGLWEGHDVMQVASPEGWRRDPALVLDFYNKRRAQLQDVVPNKAHYALAQLEQKYELIIVTQNVDDLHERAGSTHVVHLHGELKKVRSIKNSSTVFDWSVDLNIGDNCAEGGQLRPHIVWFGEAVPLLEVAVEHCIQADLFVIIGTSLQVYPAAGLIDYVREGIPKYYIDASPAAVSTKGLVVLAEKASSGVPKLVAELMELI
jgi:NAD-dependent deacetylase